jgi:hypothetical protein
MGARVNDGLLLVGFFFSLGLPIVTVFVPQNWLPAFDILPNYWMGHTVENLFIGPGAGPGFWLSGFIKLWSSLALVTLALPILRRQLKLRQSVRMA